jgi:hypothetical protein
MLPVAKTPLPLVVPYFCCGRGGGSFKRKKTMNTHCLKPGAVTAFGTTKDP